jgi:hypothetical protein
MLRRLAFALLLLLSALPAAAADQTLGTFRGTVEGPGGETTPIEGFALAVKDDRGRFVVGLTATGEGVIRTRQIQLLLPADAATGSLPVGSYDTARRDKDGKSAGALYLAVGSDGSRVRDCRLVTEGTVALSMVSPFAGTLNFTCRDSAEATLSLTFDAVPVDPTQVVPSEPVAASGPGHVSTVVGAPVGATITGSGAARRQAAGGRLLMLYLEQEREVHGAKQMMPVGAVVVALPKDASLGAHDLKPFSQSVAADKSATDYGVSFSLEQGDDSLDGCDQAASGTLTLTGLDPLSGSARFTCADQNDLAVETDFDGIPTTD